MSASSARAAKPPAPPTGLDPLANIPGDVTLLARYGWTREASTLTALGKSKNRFGDDTYRHLCELIANSKPLVLPRAHEVYGVAFNAVISSLQFLKLDSYEEMREAFRQGVRWIEIETSSQCNRRCAYCPNSMYDRRSTNAFLDKALYEGKVLRDLREIDYDGEIVFVGNNEFFMHEENFDYLEEARKQLPKAVLKLVSNGDYINREMLERAARAKVCDINISLHLGSGEAYNEADVLDRAAKFSTNTGLPLQLVHYGRGQNIRFVTRLGDTLIWAGLNNYAVNGHSWGSLMENQPHNTMRTAPCSMPLRQFVVGYAADLFMCCTAFKSKTDYNTENNAIYGNLADFPSIFHAYASDGLLAWRRGLYHNGEKQGPCATCDHNRACEEGQYAGLADFVAKRLNLG